MNTQHPPNSHTSKTSNSSRATTVQPVSPFDQKAPTNQSNNKNPCDHPVTTTASPAETNGSRLPSCGSESGSHRSSSTTSQETLPSPAGVHQSTTHEHKRSSSDPSDIQNHPEGDSTAKESIPKRGSLVFRFDAKTENVSFSAIAESEAAMHEIDDGERSKTSR